MYENSTTGLMHGCGLLQPKAVRKKLASAGDVMPIYSQADIIAKCRAAGGELGLTAFPLCATDQSQTDDCWLFSGGQSCEALEWSLTGIAERLDISIAINKDGAWSGGNDIHAMWTDGVEPYGICTAEFMGTDPSRLTNKPAMLRGFDAFPAGWQAEAAKRKGIERYECEDFAMMCSAILNNHPCGLGVDCPGGGHAVTAWIVGVDAHGRLYTRGNGSWGSTYASGWASNPKYPGTYTLYENMTEAAWGGFGCQAYVGTKEVISADLN